MMRFTHLMIAGLLGMSAVPVLAQTMPSKDVDTVKSGIGEESLAPVVVKQPPVVRAGSPTVVNEGSADVSETVMAPVAADPFTVKGVVVTLSNTIGFDRDAALEVAARQALPTVLTNLGHAPDKAAKSAKGVGMAMNFVKSFKVVKETLLPSYTLTADLTFNGPMVLKNFGGKVTVTTETKKVDGVVVAVSGTTATPVAVEADVPVALNKPVKQWVVRISDRDPSLVDRVRTNLAKQPGTKATYRLLTSAGAELVVDTPMTSADISRYAGHEVEVVELEVPLPTATVQLESGGHPWQGQAQPNAPASLNEPSVPGAPSSPEGTY